VVSTRATRIKFGNKIGVFREERIKKKK